MSMASEFKQFAMKGNVVDMAVGVIIGAAFGKIVSQLRGQRDHAAAGHGCCRAWIRRLAVELGEAPDGMPILLKYGAFLQTALDFVIIALCLFLAIKAINR